jgi:hypothetical protein
MSAVAKQCPLLQKAPLVLNTSAPNLEAWPPQATKAKEHCPQATKAEGHCLQQQASKFHLHIANKQVSTAVR